MQHSAQRSVTFQDPDTKAYYKLTLDNGTQYRTIEGSRGSDESGMSLREKLRQIIASGEVNEDLVRKTVFNHIKVERMAYDVENVELKLHEVDLEYREEMGQDQPESESQSKSDNANNEK